ncbi:MAG: phytanoyl-CoA dioxygenase [Lysobacter sp.]|nr:phytanoyl-CoA dioxygenase [Lysobacter sp.]
MSRAMLAEAGWQRVPSGLPRAWLGALPMDPALDAGDAGSRNLLAEAWCSDLVAPLRNGLQSLGLLSNDAVAVQCTLFRKTPDCNWKVPYHQDLSIPVAGRVEHPALSGWSVKEDGLYVQPPVELLDGLLAARLHLDPCGDDDGALRVVPGTHRLGRLSPQRIAAMDKRRDEVVCVADVGDVLLMRPLVLHASSKAERPKGRRVLHFLFAPPDPGCGLQWRIAV